jgi:alcohol dehydrogenase (cytochrome c)
VHRSRDGSRQAGAPRRVETPTDGASVGEKQLKRLFASAAVALAALTYQSVSAQPAGEAPTAAAGVALPGVAAPPTPPVTDAMLRRPADSDWLMWRGGFASWGYSPLTQITSANVRTLKLAWSRGMSAGSNQGMPLVHAGVMYLPNPTDVIQALDAATGDLFWEHRRQWPDDIAKTFPTPTPNRSLALYGDKVIAASADDFIYALDAKTGKQAWETTRTPPRRPPAPW